MNMLNIITPSRLSGAERLVGLLSQWESKNGHHPTVLIKNQPSVENWFRELGLNPRVENISGKLNLLAVSKIRKVIKECQSQVVHTHLSTASLWGSLAARKEGIPSVAHVHALNTKTAFRFADKIIAVSNAVRYHLVEQGIRNEKIVVVRPVAPALGEPIPKPAEDVVGFGEKLVVQIGHLSNKKGQSIALAAATKVWESFPDTHFLFVGDGPDKEILVKESNGDSRIHFLGFRNDIMAILAASKIAILPSLGMEGMPAVIQEAQYAGLPVVATNVGGVPEQISDGENGFLIEPNDSNSLARKILLLLSDKNEYHRMSDAAKQWSNSLSFEQCCRDTVSVLQSAVKEYGK